MYRHRVAKAAAAAAAGLTGACLTLAGCQFAVVPPKPRPTHADVVHDPPAVRLTDAPALVVQCAIWRAGLRPGSQDWLHGQRVYIDETNALNFSSWYKAHETPGPYRATFIIDGHRTHYLAFGATWVNKGGQWVPTHTALNDPLAQRTSIYYWAIWAATNDRLPPQVCGTSVTARALQAQIYGPSGNPW
jgi:hypothetical protein